MSTTLRCRGQEHRLRWEAGALVADDHADAEAEKTLRALGGELPSCLRLQARWSAYADDVALVTLGRRPGEASLGLAPDVVGPLVNAVERRLGPSGPTERGPGPSGPTERGPGPSGPTERGFDAPRRRADLLSLFSLPLPFIDRLVLGAFAHAARSWGDEGFRAAHGLRLGAAFTARATPALRRLGERLHPTVEVACAPAAAAEPTSVRAELSADVLYVTAELSPWWVPSVWGAGISEPDGCFVLEVIRPDRGGLAVDQGEWEATGARSWRVVPRPAHLRRDDEGFFSTQKWR